MVYFPRMLLSRIDYLLQGIIALLVFVHPWFLHPWHGRRAFSYPFFAICAWGMWRVVHFDLAMKNDVPGIGYFAAAPVYGAIAWGLYKIGTLIRRRMKKHRPTPL